MLHVQRSRAAAVRGSGLQLPGFVPHRPRPSSSLQLAHQILSAASVIISMTSPVPTTKDVKTSRRSIAKKFLNFIHRNPASLTKSIDESRGRTLQSQPDILDSTSYQSADSNVDTPATDEKFSHLTQTADSVVTFILGTLQGLGSNLPGIGAVGVVLSIKDKFMVFCYLS